METFQATAPDLDEIIVGSDEENADLLGSCAQGSESVTMSQLIERFRKVCCSFLYSIILLYRSGRMKSFPRSSWRRKLKQ